MFNLHDIDIVGRKGIHKSIAWGIFESWIFLLIKPAFVMAGWETLYEPDIVNCILNFFQAMYKYIVEWPSDLLAGAQVWNNY